LLATISGALGIGRSDGASAIDALVERLGRRETLLVLDNFEHIASAAPAVSELLATSPTLRIAVTSRAPLHVAGEQEYPVAPLELAEPDGSVGVDRLREIESVALFVARARSVRPDLDLGERSLRAAAAICRRLDGLPLAIELAAARTKVLSAEALLRRLELGSPALAVGPADAPARQRTVLATIEWSYDLLSPSEQRTFTRLGVFVGGLGVPAAAEVLQQGVEQSEDDVLEPLSRLVDHSLLQVDRDADGEPRFRMLEPIREFALDRLSVPELRGLRDRHLDYYLRLAEAEQAHERGDDQRAWIRRLVADKDNIRAALAHALERRDAERVVRLAGALERRFWLASGDLDLQEGRRWLEAALAVAPGAPASLRARALLRLSETHAMSSDRIFAVLHEALAESSRADDEAGVAEALSALGSMEIYGGELDAAEGHLTRALALARRLDAKPERLVALLISLGLLASRRREPSRGRPQFEEALAVARRAGDASGSGTALGHLGRIALTEGDTAQAVATYAEGVELARGIGDLERLGMALCDLASAQIESGELVPARRLIVESAATTRGLNWWYQVRVLDAAAQWLFAAGAIAEAVVCLSAADRTRPQTEMDWDPDRVATRDWLIDRARRVMPRSAFMPVWEVGQTLDLGAALARSLVAIEAAVVQPHGPSAGRARGRRDLSPRELEVVALVADGRSDGEIAFTLGISKKTASAHVAHIKDKLGAESRVEIVVRAIRLGIVDLVGAERAERRG
jgi:predicted ATPase/DNA-binding CsgD family transcriptional regulator